MSQNKGSILGATLLVAGTCIGGGMLALPVATVAAGFIPSFVLMVVGWVFMTCTALFLAEVNLWMEEGVHVMTMASRLLGPLGKGIAWLLYLFIGYASLVAYAAGGGDLLAAAISRLWGISLAKWVSISSFVVLFGAVLYLGSVTIGRINSLLMVGLILAYILLISLGAPYVQGEYLLESNWRHTLEAVPLLLTIFSFQTIVPSLTLYLKQDGRSLRLAIVLGTTVALCVYAIWEWLVLGVVPKGGPEGLEEALALGKPATIYLGLSVGNVWLGAIADFFAFFALVTSFFGIALGLFDFLADGLKIPRKGWGHLVLGVLVGGPTLFFSLGLEKVFLRALDASGGIGDAILNGLFPACMLWVGRYKRGYVSDYRTPGGKPLLLLVILYALFVFTVEILGKNGWIHPLGR